MSFTLHEAARLTREERSRITRSLMQQARANSDRAQRRQFLDDVVVINLRVAHAIANRYRGRGVALEDLQQAASEGLAKAVARFDLDRHHDLLSFAVPTMRGEVLRHFRDHAWTVRPSRRIQELHMQIPAVAEDLHAELGRSATTAEMCHRLDVDEAQYREALQARGYFRPPSIDSPSETGATIADVISDPRAPELAVEARVLLGRVWHVLSERERRILHLRFVEERTQQEIGQEYGVAQMQVSRWLNSIFTRLRREIGDVQAA